MPISTVGLTNAVNGILPVANGGTGTSTGVAPGGSTTQVQYNNAGAFGGDSGFVYTSSKVGIGASSPAATLDVGSSINRTGASPNNIYSDMRITGTTTGTAATFLSRIVGIGGSTYTIPAAAVYQVADTVAQTGVTVTNAYGLYIGNMNDPSSGGSVTNPWGIYQSTSSNKNYFGGTVGVAITQAARGYLDVAQSSGSGNAPLAVSRGGDAGPMVNFYVTNSSTTIIGNIYNAGGTNTQYNTSSDYRLKENIAPMTGALAKVKLLKPCTYTWKLTGAEGQGFIAHELQEVIPDAVHGEKDAVDEDGNVVSQGIDTSYVVATLTAAIQELKAEFDAYKRAHP
jgi:hypothetical protein